MAIQSVNENMMPRGPVESMKQHGNEVAKAEKTKPTQLQSIREDNKGFNEPSKGFNIDTKA